MGSVSRAVLVARTKQVKQPLTTSEKFCTIRGPPPVSNKVQILPTILQILDPIATRTDVKPVPDPPTQSTNPSWETVLLVLSFVNTRQLD